MPRYEVGTPVWLRHHLKYTVSLVYRFSVQRFDKHLSFSTFKREKTFFLFKFRALISKRCIVITVKYKFVNFTVQIIIHSYPLFVVFA